MQCAISLKPEIELVELDAKELYRVYSQVHQGVAVELAKRSEAQAREVGRIPGQLKGLEAPPYYWYWMESLILTI